MFELGDCEMMFVLMDVVFALADEALASAGDDDGDISLMAFPKYLLCKVLVRIDYVEKELHLFMLSYRHQFRACSYGFDLLVPCFLYGEKSMENVRHE